MHIGHLLSPLLWLAVAHQAHASVDWPELFDRNGGQRVHFGSAIDGIFPYRRNEGESLAPASTAKLFTAGAALEILGADFRYPTVLRWIEAEPGIAQSLTLIGHGDPSWGMIEFGEGLQTRLNLLVTKLKAAGVKSVRGDPVAQAADLRWNALSIPEGWKSGDTSSCGGSLAQAFNMDINCAELKVSSANQASWQSDGLDFPVRLRIRTGSSTSLNASLNHDPRGSYFVIEGSWKSGTAPQSLYLPIYDTRPWIQKLFKKALAASGIRMLPASAGRPAGSPRQIVTYSEPLPQLLRPFLKNSINFMGDAFLKTIGSRAGPADSPLLTSGLQVLREYLLQNNANRDFDLNDGSGLSRTSRATAEMMLSFLERMKRSPLFPALWAALPVAGVDGTLRNRMKGSAAAGVLRAKTGTLDGVYNLAGYVPYGKDFVPFVILTRTDSSESATARAAEDRVGIALASVHASSETLTPQTPELFSPVPYVPRHAGADDQ